MQTLILAAGRGTRLAPLTDTMPKVMVKVAGQPLIERLVRQCVVQGLTDLFIVVGYHGETVRAHLGDGSTFGAVIKYIEQGELGGTGHAVRAAEPFITDDFMMIFGDTLLPDGTAIGRARAVATPAAVGVSQVEEPSRYGIVTLDQNHCVESIIEKPADPPSNLAVMAMYKLPLTVFEALKGIGKSSRGEVELPDAVRILIAQGVAFTAVDITGVRDVGTLADLEAANQETMPVETILKQA